MAVNIRALWAVLLAAALLASASQSRAQDVSNSTWSETDANNNSTPPSGWPSTTMLPLQVAPSGRAVMGGVKRFWDRINGTVTTTGSANAYVYTPTNTSYPTAITTGEQFCAKANFSNTGASTIAVNGLTAKNIFKHTASGAAALAANDIRSGDLFCVQSDGTQYQLMTVPGTIAAASFTGILGVANGGTGADLSATGGASQVLKQASVGGVVTVGQLAASDLSNGTSGAGAVLLASGAMSGGTVNNSVIGGVTPAAITGTTITANTAFRGTDFGSGSTSTVSITTSGGTGLSVRNRASAVNRIDIIPGATGGPAVLSAIGETDAAISIASSGTGNITFNPAFNGNDALRIVGTASYTRGFILTPSAGGDPKLDTSAGSMVIASAGITGLTLTGGNAVFAGAVTTTGNFTSGDTAFLLRMTTAQPNGAGAQTATMTNGPASGNPTKWMPISDGGTTRYVPAW